MIDSTTTSYTVYRTDGLHPQSGLSVEEAVDTLLSVDGFAYKIVNRPDGAFELFRSRFSRNAFGGPGLMRSVFVCPTLDDLYAAVLATEWNGGYCAMTDAEYNAMMAAAADASAA